jgi:hypothetical protein
MIRKLKRQLRFLAGTPLHPQWLAASGRRNLIDHLNAIGPGKIVLDIGCFDKWPKKHLPSASTYIGLDYLPTALNWYRTKPDVCANGSILPVASEAVDVVLFFDVCVHVAQTERLAMKYEFDVARSLPHSASLARPPHCSPTWPFQRPFSTGSPTGAQPASCRSFSLSSF